MQSPSSSVRRAQPLLGTFVEVSARGAPSRLSDAIDRAFGVIARIHALMSFHEPGSDVARLNRCAHKEPVGVDPHTWFVLAAAERMARASDGAFDITVAPALVRFGFLPATEAPPPAGRARGFEAIELLPRGRVRFTRPTWIDLGGIAKGYAVDVACDALEQAGVTDYLVNAGGDLRVGAAAEPVHLRHPARPEFALPLGLFADAALATSAAYFAGRPGAAGDVHPIIAPGSGEPACYHGSITVSAHACIEADALTKVLAVKGAAAAPVLQDFDAEAWLLSTSGSWQRLGRAMPAGASRERGAGVAACR